ncbi:MAG: sle1 [Streptosporangiaceae bacterium]|nr:sle1 [Streptosporangiaceae bacterium]
MRQVRAAHLRTLHLVAMGTWALPVIPTLLFWTNSVPFLVFVSLYANFVGHFSSWQAARSEES